VTEPNSTPPADSFEEFARATGLDDLLGLDASALYPADDTLQEQDADGDWITVLYQEATADDGEACGLTSIATGGPSGVVLLDSDAMDALAEWLKARAARSRALKLEQGR
jgi:hypothetical protein